MGSDENEERALKRLTVRELRQKAVKSLGAKVAAGLKAKQELVDALVAKAAAKAKAPKPVKEVKPTAKKSPPKKAAAPAKKSPPKKSPPKKSPPKAVAAAEKRPSPPKAVKVTKVSKAETVAEAYELPITRDFFVDPKRPALPAAYGDDRLLCFRREPLAIVVSWDLSANTFADGVGLTLELVTTQGRLAGSTAVHSPTGLATFEQLPEGKPLTVQVVRRGRVMTRGRPFLLGSVRAEGAGGAGAWQMTVPIDQPLPQTPEREEWADAPAVAARSKAHRASSSRLSS